MRVAKNATQDKGQAGSVGQPASLMQSIMDGQNKQGNQAGQQDDGAYQAHVSRAAGLPARVATSLFPLMQSLGALGRYPTHPVQS